MKALEGSVIGWIFLIPITVTRRMKSLLVVIAFTVLCYTDFADSQTGYGKFPDGVYASNGAHPPIEPGGHNIQYQGGRAVSGTTSNFGPDGMRNGGLPAGPIVDLQSNKEVNVNSPQRFMPGNLPFIRRPSTDGRQFNGGLPWGPVNNGGVPNGNIHGPGIPGNGIGGANRGNVLPGVYAKDATGGRGFNNIPNIRQDSQTGYGRFPDGAYASSGAHPPIEPGGHNIQYQGGRAAAERMGNFGTDGMRNGGLPAVSNVDLQSNKGVNNNSPQRFMPGNLPGISRTSVDGRQFYSGSAVNNGGAPNGNVYGPAGRNIGGWNSGANVLPGVYANDATRGRGLNNIPITHQVDSGNAGGHFSDLNKDGIKLDDGLMKEVTSLISSFIKNENARKSGSFADGGKARTGFAGNADNNGPGRIQRYDNARDNFPNNNVAEGYGKRPLGNDVRVPISNGQPVVRQPYVTNNVRNDMFTNGGTSGINAPNRAHGYDSSNSFPNRNLGGGSGSGFPNKNIYGNVWNGPFRAGAPFVRGQPVVRPGGMPAVAQPTPVRPGAMSAGEGSFHSAGQGNSRTIDGTNIVPPNRFDTSGENQRHASAVNPDIYRGTSEGNKAGTGFQENGSKRNSLDTTNSTETTEKQMTVSTEKSVSNASSTGTSGSANQETAYGSSGTDTKEASVLGSNNGGDTSGTTESRASSDDIHKGQKKKGHKHKGKKRKGKKRKGKKGKGKKSKTVSGSKKADSYMESDDMNFDGMDKATAMKILNENKNAANGEENIKECFGDE